LVVLAIIGILTTMSFSLRAAILPMENFCPHFSTNILVVWQAPTNQLPTNLGNYKMLVPRPFKAGVLSNAVMLASLENLGFPKPDTNLTCYSDDCHCSCVSFCYFTIAPESGAIQFTEPHRNDLSEAIPDEKQILNMAWECAAQFGINRKELIPRKVYVSNCDSNRICGRGIFLSRSLDGIGFRGNGNDGYSPEGFGIEVGGDWQIRSFTITWPDLKRSEKSRTLNADEIIACLRAQKAIVLPNNDEEKYFERIKWLANATKVTITKVTPYYGEGILGDTNDIPAKVVSPYAEIEAIADLENTNVPFQFVSPIIASDMNRLLAKTPSSSINR
jgi:hypothetical protein